VFDGQPIDLDQEKVNRSLSQHLLTGAMGFLARNDLRLFFRVVDSSARQAIYYRHGTRIIKLTRKGDQKWLKDVLALSQS
jgi:hypothetical protein